MITCARAAWAVPEGRDIVLDDMRMVGDLLVAALDDRRSG